MNTRKFERIVKEFIEEVNRVRFQAQQEYAETDNVFQNFEETAERLGISREEVLYVFLDKHLRGVARWIRGVKDQRDAVEGRIIDAINYLIILYAMIRDEEDKFKEEEEDL